MEEILKIFTLSVRDGEMIALGALVFFVFWQLIHQAIFRPFLALFEERESLTTGATESARTMLDEAATLEREYESKLHDARVAAIAQKIQNTTNAKKEAASIIGGAESQVQSELKKSRENQAATKERLRGELGKDVESLAQMVAQRVASPGGAQ